MSSTPDETAGPTREDNDDLVRAAERLCGADNIRRGPGLIEFVVDDPIRKRAVGVMRSRFDGDYGNICRMTGSVDGIRGPMTFAPTAHVIAAMSDKTCAAERLVALYTEWVSKAKRKG